MRLLVLIACVPICLSGCVSPVRPDLGRVSIGMTKADVVGSLGKPSQVFAADGVEVLGYEYDRWGDGPYGGAWAFVRLKEGRVIGYGEDDKVAYSGNPAAATAAGMSAIGIGLAAGGLARPTTNVTVYNAP